MTYARFAMILLSVNIVMLILGVSNNTNAIDPYGEIDVSTGTFSSNTSFVDANATGSTDTGTPLPTINTLFLSFNVVKSLGTNLLFPWTLLNELGFPSEIAYLFGVTLFALNLIILIALIIGRGSMSR